MPYGIALLSLLGTIFSAVMNWRSQSNTNDLQQNLANQANAWQTQNRDYENWYNSPAGLQSRGLNPALAMSAGGAGLAQSASAGQANLPSDLKAPQISDMGNSLMSSLSGANQLEVNQSVIDLNKAQARRLDTQSQLDWKNLDETQKRTLIMQQNADTYSRDVDSKVKDLENQIFNRDRRFELDKDMQEFTKNVKQEELKQAWEQIHINEENLRVTLELLPFIKAEKQAQIDKFVAEAKKANKETEILEINRQYAQLLQSIRDEFNSEYKAFVTGQWSAETAKSSMITAQSIQERGLAEHPFWYWCYAVLSGGSGVVSNLGNATEHAVSLASVLGML